METIALITLGFDYIVAGHLQMQNMRGLCYYNQIRKEVWPGTRY